MNADYLAPCYNRFSLFDSTHLADHLVARRSCADYQIRDECSDMRPPWAEGTWAGKLFKNGDPVAVDVTRGATA